MTPPQPTSSGTPSSLHSPVWAVHTWSLHLDRRHTLWPYHLLRTCTQAHTPCTCCICSPFSFSFGALLQMDLLSFFELACDISGVSGFTHPFLRCLLSCLLLWPPLHCHCHLHTPLCLHLLPVLLLLLHPHTLPPLVELGHAKVIRVVVILFELGLQLVLDVGYIRHDGGKGLRDLARLDVFYIRADSSRLFWLHFSTLHSFPCYGLQGFRPKREILSYPSFSPSSTPVLWTNSGSFIPPDFWTWAMYLLQSLSTHSCKHILNPSVPLAT